MNSQHLQQAVSPASSTYPDLTQIMKKGNIYLISTADNFIYHWLRRCSVVSREGRLTGQMVFIAPKGLFSK